VGTPDPWASRFGFGVASLVATLALAGCGGRQSALLPRGEHAAEVFHLTLVMTLAGALILTLVTILVVLGLLGGSGVRRRLPGRRLLVGGGIVFPVVTLTLLLVWEIAILARLDPPADDGTLRVEVTGHQYWWDVRYLGPAGAEVTTANELALPAGSKVELALRTADVLHSFWIPSLGGKMDLIPGRTNRLTLTTGDPVVLRGQCAEFCGAQHALMAFDVEVLPPAGFAAWLEQQRSPAAAPTAPLLAEGRDAFLASGCGACHAVRGTPAAGRLGPDLTHVGGRRTIAAGSFPTNVGTLAGWIADAQHLKQGNRMPSFGNLDGRTLRAIAAWLGSLK
jgi:cytochrome c oxidase subunit 2